MNATATPPRISEGQFFWLVTASVVAGGLYLWPTPLLVAAGPDAPIALLGAGLLGALLVVTAFAWGGRVRGRALFDRLERLWGPFAWGWMVGSGCLFLVLDGALLALYVGMLVAFFFPGTPPWVLGLLLATMAFLLARKPADTLARNIGLWLVLALLGFFALAATALATADAHAPGLSALRPAWPPSAGGVLRGIGATWFLVFDAGAAALTFAPAVHARGRAGVRNHALFALLFQVGMLAVVAVLALTLLGPWASRSQLWPVVQLMVGVGPTSGSFLRPSLIILPVWTAAFISYLAVRIHGVSVNTAAVLAPGQGGRAWHALVLTAGVLAIAWRAPPLPALLPEVVDVLGPIALVWSVALHTLSFVLAAVRAGPPDGVRRRRDRAPTEDAAAATAPVTASPAAPPGPAGRPDRRPA